MPPNSATATSPPKMLTSTLRLANQGRATARVRAEAARAMAAPAIADAASLARTTAVRSGLIRNVEVAVLCRNSPATTWWPRWLWIAFGCAPWANYDLGPLGHLFADVHERLAERVDDAYSGVLSDTASARPPDATWDRYRSPRTRTRRRDELVWPCLGTD